HEPRDGSTARGRRTAYTRGAHRPRADRQLAMPTAVKHPFIPVELANAAFRYGHSQIRPMYAIRAGAAPMAVFPDLIGFSPVGDRAVDSSMLFDVPGRPAAQRSKRIDGTLPASLIELPREITGAASDSAYRSL